MQGKYNCHLLHPSMSPVNEDNKIKRLDIMIDSYCNLKCVMCTNRSEVNQGFADEKFWHELEYTILKDVEEIELVGGEPFISKDTYRLIDLVLRIKPSIRWCFTTNGHFDFDKLLRGKLQGLNIYSFAVSIDSFDKENFSKIRVDGKLEKALSTLCALKNAKEELGLSYYLTCNFLIQKDNYKEIHKALSFQKETGIPVYFIILREPENFSIFKLEVGTQFEIIHDLLECASEFKSLKTLNCALKILKEFNGPDKILLNTKLLEVQSELKSHEEV